MEYILTNAAAILTATVCGLIVTVSYAAIARRAGSDGVGGLGLGALAFVAQGWLACILAGALILAPQKAGAWTMALGSAGVIWFGFVLPTLVLTLHFRGSRIKPALIDAAVWLAIMLVQAGVLHAIGLTKPA